MTFIPNIDWKTNVNFGGNPNFKYWHQFGWRGNATTNHHHLWNDPTANTDMVFQTVAEDYNIITTGNDTAAGSGCQSVYVMYLDENFIEQTKVVATNAGTQAAGITAIRLQRVFALDNGTYGGSNQNLITINGAVSGNNYGFLEAGEGQTQRTQYCVPAGKTARIEAISITTEANKPANFVFHKRENADDIISPFTSQRVLHQWDGIDAPLGEDFIANHILPEKTDVWVGCDMVSGTGILQFDYDILEKNI